MQAVHHRLGRDIDVSDQLEIVSGFNRRQSATELTGALGKGAVLSG
jgi:hypothetical protein